MRVKAARSMTAPKKTLGSSGSPTAMEATRAASRSFSLGQSERGR